MPDPSATPQLHPRHRLAILEADASLVRQETLNGREYTVAPVVALREGVHNGEFIDYKELAIFPEVWNGKPLPIDHPKDGDGFAITASTPEILENDVVGQFLNVVADEDIRAIRGEIWIDNEKAAAVSGGQESIDRVVAGEQLEVSTGYFTFIDNLPGEWVSPSGEVIRYTASQSRIGPDHLALLPFDLGACSWEDGCGAPRVNSGEGTDDPQTEQTDGHVVRSETDMPNPATDKSLKVNGKQLGNALTFALKTHGDGSEMLNRLAVAAGITSEQMQSLANGELDFAPRAWLNVFAAVLDLDPWDFYMAASNDNADARYTQNGKDGSCGCGAGSGTGPEATQQAEENVDEKGDPVTITHNRGDEEQESRLHAAVLKVLEKVGLTKNEEVTQMTVQERVDAVIASEKTAFNEDSRDVLMTMNEDQLALLEPAAETDTDDVAENQDEPEAEPGTGTPPAETTEVETAQAVQTVTKDVILEALGIKSEDLDALKAANKQTAESRNARIKKLAAHKDCTFTEEELGVFSDGMLAKTEKSIEADETPVTWRTAAGAVTNSDDEDAPPAPPQIVLGGSSGNSRIAKALGVTGKDGGK